nr:MAG TPA: hypothetical protein [Caudoviricetes sp.]
MAGTFILYHLIRVPTMPTLTVTRVLTAYRRYLPRAYQGRR